MSYLLDKFLDLVFWIAGAVIGLLPNYTWTHSTALTALITAINTVDQYFPVDTLVEIIGVYLVYYAIVLWVRPLLKFARLA